MSPTQEAAKQLEGWLVTKLGVCEVLWHVKEQEVPVTQEGNNSSVGLLGLPFLHTTVHLTPLDTQVQLFACFFPIQLQIFVTAHIQEHRGWGR